MRAILYWIIGFSLAVNGCSSQGKRTDENNSDSGPDTDTDSDTDTDTDTDSDTDSDFWDNGCNDTVPGGYVRLTGRVMGPGGIFPVARALVAAYDDQASIPEIPDYAYCEECVDIDGIPAELTSPDGAFCLDVPEGTTVHIVVQKGQFRRVRQYDVPSDATGDIALSQDLVTLPSTRDDASGDMMPNIALALGDYDAIEDILGKAGIGEVDVGYSWIEGSENQENRYDIFDNKIPGSFLDPNYGEKLDDLILDLSRMMQYHIIFFPCSYNANWSFMLNQQVIDNMRDYVWAGGKLYVSDYGYYVADMPWNDFLEFSNKGDPCGEAASPSGCNHGPPFDSPGTVNDDLMREWLELIMEDNGDTLGDLVLMENWDNIGDIGPGYVGEDPDSGDDIMMEPKVWVEGPWAYDPEDWPSAGFDAESPHPLTVSWPYNCGRVVYTTYHTMGTTQGGQHSGLFEQEMILYFLLMEIGVCQDDVPVIE